MSLANVFGSRESVTRHFNGISVDVPRDWEDSSAVVLRSPDRQGGFRVNIVVTRNLAKADLEGSMEALRTELMRDPAPALELDEPQACLIDGLPALQMDARHDLPLLNTEKSPVLKLAVRFVLVIKGEQLFNVILTDVAEFFAAHQSNIKTLLKGVKLPA